MERRRGKRTVTQMIKVVRTLLVLKVNLVDLRSGHSMTLADSLKSVCCLESSPDLLLGSLSSTDGSPASGSAFITLNRGYESAGHLSAVRLADGS